MKISNVVVRSDRHGDLVSFVADHPREDTMSVIDENTAWSCIWMRLQQVLSPMCGSKDSTGCVRDKQQILERQRCLHTIIGDCSPI